MDRATQLQADADMDMLEALLDDAAARHRHRIKPVLRLGWMWTLFPGTWVRAWECSTGEAEGRGRTPRAAYVQWQKQFKIAMHAMQKHRNVGGSILPSNDAQILKPRADLQVRVIAEHDTHGLFRVSDGTLLARHPNGYSCAELMKRIISGKKPREQAEYIVMCGGHVSAEGWALCANIPD